MNILFLSPAITVYISILVFFAGAVFGSFINCMAWRIVHHEKWWTGRSHCAVCGHPLGAADLVPVFSYLFLRGRCRYCHEKISPRYMITELLSGGAFLGLLYAHGDVTLLFFRDAGLSVILLGLSLVDLEILEIPDGFIRFGIVWWILFQVLDALQETITGASGFRFSAFLNQLIAESWRNLLCGFIFSGIILIISLIMDRILKQESFGGGDIKLLFLTNLYLGFGRGLFSIIAACLLGLIYSAASKKRRIPFGPFISLGTLIGLLVGTPVVNWYLSLFL